jgi:hypothetical protein
MALTAGADQVNRVDRRTWVGRRKDVMRGMTVRASRYLCGVADLLNLPVIGLFIIMNNLCGEMVPLHHRLIDVAVLAFLSVELPCLSRITLHRGVEDPYVVKTVTIRAGSRILITSENRLPVAGSHIFFISVAFGTFFDYGLLDIFVIGLDGVDVLVTIVTPEVQLDIMEILLVFPGDLLVTFPAGHGRWFLLARHVAVNVPYIHMTTRAAVISVNRLWKFCVEKIFIMAELAVRCPSKRRLYRQKHRRKTKRSCPHKAKE